MTANINVPTGLHFATDFRDNNKDADYRPSSSRTGTILTTGATLTAGFADFPGIQSDNGIAYPVGADNISPTLGFLLLDIKHDDAAAKAGTNDIVLDIRPETATNKNRCILERSAGTDNYKVTLRDTASAALESPIVAGFTNTRSFVMVGWSGYTGSGTANTYVGIGDGNAPSVSGFSNKTRDTSVNSGNIRLGFLDQVIATDHWMRGNYYSALYFTVSNPCGQNLLATGWKHAAILNEIYPPKGNGVARFSGQSLGGTLRFGSGCGFRSI